MIPRYAKYPTARSAEHSGSCSLALVFWRRAISPVSVYRCLFGQLRVIKAQRARLTVFEQAGQDEVLMRALHTHTNKLSHTRIHTLTHIGWLSHAL